MTNKHLLAFVIGAITCVAVAAIVAESPVTQRLACFPKHPTARHEPFIDGYGYKLNKTVLVCE